MLYVKDLPESDRERKTIQHEDGPIIVESAPYFLYCSDCDGRYSATRGDYFWHPADKPMSCSECGEGIYLELARERNSIEIIELSAVEGVES